MRIKIYNIHDRLKMTVSSDESSTGIDELMREYSISLSFTNPEGTPIEVGDYAECEGRRYVALWPYRPTQKNSMEFSYGFKLFDPIHKASQVMFLLLNDNSYNSQFSFDGPARDHLRMLVDNLNRIPGNHYEVGDVVDNGYKTISYNKMYCWDALGAMAEAFDTEWWVDENHINLCRCERGESATLAYHKGLTGLYRTDNDGAKFFTRLIPLGSTRNIDFKRYGSQRLQLPDKSTYIDRNTELGLVEHVEEDAFKEIYPHYEGTVSSVRHEERTGKDDKNYTVYYIKDDAIDFNPNEHEIGGLTKHIVFKSGALKNRDFEANYDADSKEWEIINQYPDEKMQIPNEVLAPKTGDLYTCYNITMPDEYNYRAEQQFKEAVDDFLKKYAKDVSRYGGDTDYIDISERNVPLIIGQRTSLESKEYFGNVPYKTRITKIARKLDRPTDARLEFTNQVAQSWKSNVAGQLSKLQYTLAQSMDNNIDILKNLDDREVNDYRVMSALRTLSEIKHRALRKDMADTTSFLIEFLAGAKFGEFAPGLTGYGGHIDAQGRGELESLFLRSELIVPILTYNQVKYIGGEQWQSKGEGTILSVNPEQNTFQLKLKEGEAPKLEAGDLCKTIYSDGHGESTSFFKVLEVGKDGLIRYELKPGTTVHPHDNTNIAQFGNTSDKGRQSSKYSTTTYTRYLTGVDSWDITEENIAMQFGDLSNLTIAGEKLEGYSAYLSNIYLSGIIRQLPEIVKKEVEKVTLNWEVLPVNAVPYAPLDVNSNISLKGGDGSIRVVAQFLRNGVDVTEVMRKSTAQLYQFKRVSPLGRDDASRSDEEWNRLNAGRTEIVLGPDDVMYACTILIEYDTELLELEYGNNKDK